VTSSNTSRRQVRTMAGVMLVAVGLVNDAPPVTTVGGLSIAADQNQ
jgi:hypothetical protein